MGYGTVRCGRDCRRRPVARPPQMRGSLGNAFTTVGYGAAWNSPAPINPRTSQNSGCARAESRLRSMPVLDDSCCYCGETPSTVCHAIEPPRILRRTHGCRFLALLHVRNPLVDQTLTALLAEMHEPSIAATTARSRLKACLRCAKAQCTSCAMRSCCT